jgi:hypothetical protein
MKMNHRLVLISRGRTKRIQKLVSLGMLIVVSAIMTGCGWRPENVFGKSITNTATVTIQDATASRDPVTKLPVVKVNYTVYFPGGMLEQYTNAPTITCTMEQGQLTSTRTFTSQPVNLTAETLSGALNISVPEEGRAIGGLFSVKCNIASDHPLNTSNTASVDVPVIADAGKALDISGDWTLTWTWSVTTVWYVGTVSGGPDTWKYQGSLKGGNNAIWTPKVDSSQITCTLTGNPNAVDANGSSTGSISCSATFPEGPWQGKANGTLQTNSISNGMYTFFFVGSGDGTGSDGKPAQIDDLDLKSNQK